ncbi:GNAT family protein [Agromyces sp. NPDC049794]|uniref:GNAT family N-acetyltransferase n=1 Tax=unclassified Agromyces TaxID=2639701 RepID=UPI0033CD672F
MSLNNGGKDELVEKAPVFERDGSEHSHSPPEVELITVDEVVLSRLVEVATTDAAPDDVTPPLGDGWTPDRVEWLRAFHRLRRVGLAHGEEETSAIRVDGRIVGATRLHRSSPETPDQLECGIWLARSSRGLGLSKTVLRLLASRAVSAGASRIVARTTAGNAAAIAVLKRAGARLRNGPDGAVHAVVPLDEIGVVSVASRRTAGESMGSRTMSA